MELVEFLYESENMKGLTLNILTVAIILLIVAVVGTLLLSQVRAADIEQFLVSSFTGCGRKDKVCCKNNWCTSGLMCYNGKCVDSTYEILVDETYLIRDPETATRSQRSYFFNSKTGLGEESCSNADSCKNCSKIYNFTDAINCTECDICDESTKTCELCLSCNSSENEKYQELSDCLDCSICENIDTESSMAENCSICSSCSYANATTFTNDLSCSYCYQCGENVGDECISCFDCGSENYTVCDGCKRNAATTCKSKSDYELCDRLKECITDYAGGLCEVEETIPLPWDNNYSFGDTVLDIIKNCTKEDLLRFLPEGGRQKVCKLDNSCNLMGDINGDGAIDQTDIDLCANHFGQVWPPCDLDESGKVDMKDISIPAKHFGKSCFGQQYFINENPLYTPAATLKEMLESRSLTGETAGILFNDCGYNSVPTNIPKTSIFKIYSSKPELFGSNTVPKTPEGDRAVNLKIMVSNVSFEQDSSNGCTYDIYLCAQEAIAFDESDSILKFYRNFTYLNESDKIVDTRKWEFMYGSTQVNVSGTKYIENIINLSGRTADVQQIAISSVAGLRDYVGINAFVNETVGYFCVKNGLYSKLDECYKNNVSIVLNDKIPWKLQSFVVNPDTFSNIPDDAGYKYIYYDSSVMGYQYEVGVTLTLFAYTSNISNIKDKIFISPVITIKPVIAPPPPHVPVCGDNIAEWPEECDPPMASSPQCGGRRCIDITCKCESPLPQCNDGVDNDGDKLVDFPEDIHCSNADDNEAPSTALPSRLESVFDKWTEDAGWEVAWADLGTPTEWSADKRVPLVGTRSVKINNVITGFTFKPGFWIDANEWNYLSFAIKTNELGAFVDDTSTIYVMLTDGSESVFCTNRVNPANNRIECPHYVTIPPGNPIEFPRNTWTIKTINLRDAGQCKVVGDISQISHLCIWGSGRGMNNGVYMPANYWVDFVHFWNP